MTTKLERRIIDRIRRRGPITFRDFMQQSLYDPDLGYYNTERVKIGPQGDYYTSSNVHPAFGRVLARVMIELWKDEDEPLTLVEMGAGTGRLAQDILCSARDEHTETFHRLNYVIVETSASMRRLQSESLKDFFERVRWHSL